MNRTRKTEKAAEKKQDDQKHEQPTTGREHTIAKPRTTPVTGAPKDKLTAVIVSTEGPTEPAKAPAKAAKRPVREAAPPTDDGDEIVVFAFRLLRSERLELHNATGSAKASKFVKAIVLAGARGDMKAIQEIVDEVQGNRK